MKRWSLFCFFFLSTMLTYSVTISKPVYKHRSGSDLQLVKIELTDTATILHFVEQNPNGCILAKGSYIQASSGGEKLLMRYAVGLPQPLGVRWQVKDNKPLPFSLVFPKVDKAVGEIDFCEFVPVGTSGNPWKFLGIELRKIKSVYNSVIPEKFNGVWYKADGSNFFKVYFYQKQAVMDAACWKYESVKAIGTKTQIVLASKGIKRTLEIEYIGKDKLKISEVGKDSIICSKTQYFKIKVNQADDELLTSPIFKADTAFFCGVIDGFIDGIMLNYPRTIVIVYEDIVTGKQKKYKAKIDENGYFETRIFMDGPQRVLVNYFGFQAEPVLLQPGKKTFQLIIQHSDKKNCFEKGCHQCCFSGDNAELNDEIHTTLGCGVDYFDVNKVLKDHTYSDYRLLVDKELNRELLLLEKYKTFRPISKSAEALILSSIYSKRVKFLADYNLLKLNSFDRSNINELTKQLKTFKFAEADSVWALAFKKDFIMPISAMDFRFNETMKRFANNMYLVPSSTLKKLPSMCVKSIVSKGIVLTKAEKSLADSLEIIYNDTTGKKYMPRLIQFFSTYATEIKQTMDELRNNTLLEAVETIFENKSFIADLVKAQILTKKMDEFNLFTNEEMKKETDSISDKYIVSRLINQNNKLRNKILSKNANATGKKQEIPQSESENVFEVILDKYNGKVVYVDFWATWCAPCLRNIKEMKPLKKELKTDNLVFVYITGPSSPLNLWENLFPDIEGEHYRLAAKDWEALSKRFNVVSIPHAVLINKSGQVVSPKIQGLTNDDVRTMIKSELNSK